MRTVFWTCLIMISCAGCAGPATPFGAINGFGHYAKTLFQQILPGTADGAMVHFSPARQVLHGAASFSVILEDPLGVPENPDIHVTYNGEDVTEQFLAGSQRRYLDPRKRQLMLRTRSLRFMPERDNKIYVAYRRDAQTDYVVHQYAPPVCPAFAAEGRKVASLPQFRPGPGVLDSINRYSTAKSFNPYLVAGLIAQESAFDPRALSLSRAMGLTQITPLGESEVVRRGGEWPRDPDTNSMSLLELRVAMLRGHLHSGNEWRLNPDLSVRGGVEYLDYLSEYWQQNARREVVDKFLGATDLAFGELILASYNSGPRRVLGALERRGSDWLNDEELTEARKYVRRVSSYCDHFAQGNQNE